MLQDFKRFMRGSNPGLLCKRSEFREGLTGRHFIWKNLAPCSVFALSKKCHIWVCSFQTPWVVLSEKDKFIDMLHLVSSFISPPYINRYVTKPDGATSVKVLMFSTLFPSILSPSFSITLYDWLNTCPAILSVSLISIFLLKQCLSFGT